jgi:hypothetical protein
MDLFISLGSDISNERAISLSIYVSILHDDDLINIDSIEKMEVVSDENNRLTGEMPLVDLLAKYVDCVDIETRIYLIEYDNTWIEESYLEEFDTTFFAARKSNKEISIKKLGIKSKSRQHLLDHTTKYKW